VRWLALIAVAVAAACGSDRAPARAPNDPDALADELRALAGASEATRRAAVDGWRLDERAWRQTVVPTYHALYPEYARGFAAAAAPLVAQLATPGAIAARRHFAGDPRLTRAQARLRWAVPTLYPSAVAELAGAPIDAVFVHDGAGWRALVGVDAIVLARVRARDAACGDALARAGPPGRCTDVGWVVADAALRDDAAGFARACRLAAMHCANAPP
jgi:hypothetical protein